MTNLSPNYSQQPPPTNGQGIMDLIRQKYEELSATERKLADWILKNPVQATNLSINEIAQDCGVSDATVVRFCKGLGLGGFRECRVLLAQELAVRPVKKEFQGTYADVEKDDDLEIVARKITRANIDTLYDTWQNMDYQEFEKAITILLKARSIHICGEGSSGVIAQDAEYRLVRMGLSAKFYQSHMALVVGALLTKEDATIAISYSGRTREVVETQNVARNAGAKTICITSFPNSPLAQTSDIKLIQAATHPIYTAEAIPWRIVQMMMIDIICVRLWQKMGEDFLAERASKIDEALRTRRIIP